MKTLLAALFILFVTAVTAGEMVQIARCDESGACYITAENLAKLMNALEHWYDKAQTCRGA